MEKQKKRRNFEQERNTLKFSTARVKLFWQFAGSRENGLSVSFIVTYLKGKPDRSAHTTHLHKVLLLRRPGSLTHNCRGNPGKLSLLISVSLIH